MWTLDSHWHHVFIKKGRVQYMWFITSVLNKETVEKQKDCYDCTMLNQWKTTPSVMQQICYHICFELVLALCVVRCSVASIKPSAVGKSCRDLKRTLKHKLQSWEIVHTLECKPLASKTAYRVLSMKSAAQGKFKEKYSSYSSTLLERPIHKCVSAATCAHHSCLVVGTFKMKTLEVVHSAMDAALSHGYRAFGEYLCTCTWIYSPWWVYLYLDLVIQPLVSTFVLWECKELSSSASKIVFFDIKVCNSDFMHRHSWVLWQPRARWPSIKGVVAQVQAEERRYFHHQQTRCVWNS